MNLPHLLWRNLMHRKGLSLLTVLSVTLTVALIVFLMLVGDGVEEGAAKGYGPFELVVGADGSETQLAMNTFYHVGAPTGNVPSSVWEEARKDSEAAAAFALTMGDNLNGMPIVGIDPGYFAVRYGDRKLASGNLYASAGEAVLGAYAAKETGLKVGDTFRGGHGLTEESVHTGEEEEGGGHEENGEHEGHESFAYRVVGILPALHTPDDRAVFTTLDYAWAVHHTESAEGREVTAVIIKPKSLFGVQSMKLKYDAMDNVQAIYSGKAVADVVNMVDKGKQAIQVITVLCIALASITLVLSMIAAASERKRDVGLLRLIGKTQSYVWLALMGEGLLLTFLGLVMGLAAGHVAAYLSVDAVFGYSGVRLEAWTFASGEGFLAAGALALGAAAALGPAISMYRTDPLQLFRA